VGTTHVEDSASTFTSQPALLSPNIVFASFVTAVMFTQKIISTDQNLTCSGQFEHLLIFLDIRNGVFKKRIEEKLW
jgi:hypothetical protein